MLQFVANNPKAPTPALLCYDSFKLACSNKKEDKLPQVDNEKLINNEIKPYDKFWSFLFRNMHMFMLSRNNNETHAKYFNKGDLESIHKVELYTNLATYVSHYILLHINFDIGALIVGLLKDDVNSKNKRKL